VSLRQGGAYSFLTRAVAPQGRKRLEDEMFQDLRYCLRIMSKRIITAILLSVSAFSFK
jgi:hypothetical protein